ncbi:efflux RND transporter permease subunit [Massilia putida]|uniref:efflux RND transporter permease subunit n=1 Tax=Massilia putida TaxID=1141883 RepID=UPI0009521EBE|nr:MMPL family transporter [Massilia putida]
MSASIDDIELPVIQRVEDFDKQSGNWLERLIFNHRITVLVVCAAISLFLGWHATKLTVNASYARTIPQSHPFVKNYFDNLQSLKGMGNSLRIVVENTQGDIYDPEYLEVLKQINDRLFLTPGVDRAWMKSLWTPLVRWTEVSEEGYRGGPVMPDAYDGSPRAIEQLRNNVIRAGLPGGLVATDLKSSMITVPLLDTLPETGKPLDYTMLSRMLDKDVRAKYEMAQRLDRELHGLQSGKIKIHVIGFAKLVGDLIAGLEKVVGFFLVSAAIAAANIYLYTRCLRSTVLLVAVATLGVVWLLGLLHLLGYDLDPYSILVPFLIFAIGLSHGAQKMNGIMQDVGRGTHKYVAARYTFRRLFLAGLTALLTNVVGFAVLMIIDIPAIKDLAITTSIGVLILVFTKLFLVPVALSYTGVSRKAALRSLRYDTASSKGGGIGRIWNVLARLTERRLALPVVVVAVLAGIGAAGVSLTRLQIGDLDPGAPELRADSRYNRDVAYVNAHYGLSSDQFAVMVKTAPDRCRTYDTLVETERLAWELRHVPGVQAVMSAPNSMRVITSGQFEGNPKWMSISSNSSVAGVAISNVALSSPELVNADCSLLPVVAYLADHKAATLNRVVAAAEAFARAHDTKERQFLLAAGTAGIEAATNTVVKAANYRMLGLLYLAVILLCFIAFRNWRAVVVAIVPLLITSFLCEALMVALGIGVKVATLPVIALGVGVGVDYALYLLSVQLAAQRAGMPLAQAYQRALQLTGKVVALIGFTMAAAVVTWAWSPIKFQADMGILLTFMFVWNMVGALTLIPALSAFLLKGVGQQRAPVAAAAAPGQPAPETARRARRMRLKSGI